MATCPYCGGEIEFRTIEGRVVPMGCGCAQSSAPDSTPYLCRSSSATEYSDPDYFYQDFCRPTRCPKCGADVFFIRHNGGSVWLDELGWPWPKHPCFDSPKIDDCFGVANSRRLLCVVRTCRDYASLSKMVLEINCSDNIKRFALVKGGGNPKQWVGELVKIDLIEQYIYSSHQSAPLNDVAALSIRGLDEYRRGRSKEEYYPSQWSTDIYHENIESLEQTGVLNKMESRWLNKNGALYKAILDGEIEPSNSHELRFLDYWKNPTTEPVGEAERIWKLLIDHIEKKDYQNVWGLKWRMRREKVERRARQGWVRELHERQEYLDNRKEYYLSLTETELDRILSNRSELDLENDELRLLYAVIREVKGIH